MVSKRGLGVSYLVGLGLGLVAALVAQYVLLDSSQFGSTVGTGVGLILGLSFVYVGQRLFRSDLHDDHVWRVAQWGAVGLAVPTLLNGFVLLAVSPTGIVYPGMFVNLLAAGGIAGVLVGSVVELLEQHRQTRDLHRRNAVLNRVLRHNIRNDMNVVRGNAALLAEDADGPTAERLDAIRRRADGIVEVSQGARRIESFSSGNDLQTVDAVANVESAVESVRDRFEDLAVTTDLPATALVYGDDRLADVVRTVLAETARDRDVDSAVHVAVREAPGRVTLTVERDDDGRLARRLSVLERDVETKLSHLDGVDLWLAHWLVEDYGGALSATGSDGARSVASIGLRRAETLGDGLRHAVRSSPLVGG